MGRGSKRKRDWWARKRRRVYERDGYRCQGCREIFPAELLTLDHVVPRSRGGRDSDGNLQTMCQPCNVHKGDRLPGAERIGEVTPERHRLGLA